MRIAIDTPEQCQWRGCKTKPLPAPAAIGRIIGRGGEIDVDLYLCGHHAVFLERGPGSVRIAIALEAVPAVPA